MGDLVLKGMLSLGGTLDLAPKPPGGKVMVEAVEVLVEGAEGMGTVPVLLPGPPPPPADQGLGVKVPVSFNKTVTAGGAAIVTQGMCFQGSSGTWPGIVLPSLGNTTVMANGIPMNLVGDQATILPTGAPAVLDKSGQK
ncbi:MAG: hypothetical protein QOE44_2347 [Solirubrobacteraceae bacterium]|jgi:hypothetical protein|nr:hypothetical protein [Solirubrobacteraceae bacterium]